MINADLKNAKILIVDDQNSNIDILESLLEDLGYTNYTSTNDSRQAINLFQSIKPDLILLDLMMPHLNGFEIMKLLNSLILPNSYLPILVLTADITPEAKQRALSEGAKDFLSKPFELYEVTLRIKNLLETSYLYQLIENHNIILEERIKERTIDLENANKELMVLDQAKVDFLNLISHEIRTPLNGILGFTEILKPLIESAEILKYMNYIEVSAIRLEKFSYQALHITALLTGNRTLHLQEVHIQELINNTLLQLHDKVQEKGITILLQKDPSLETIPGDAELLQICFDNLTDNAVNFSPDNDTVIIKIFPENQSIICEFIDNGSGFLSEVLVKPYVLFAVGNQHIDKNTGLNLALIKLIIDLHKGQIEVRNTKPNGASVRLVFNDSRNK